MINPDSFTPGTSSMPVNVEPAGLTAGQPDAPVTSLHDHVRDILQSAPLTDDMRAELWDRVWDSEHSYRLVKHLTMYPAVPDDVKDALVAAKKETDPECLEGLETAASKIESMVTIYPDLLELAENHPAVLQSFLRS